jgi:hypothetical protein
MKQHQWKITRQFVERPEAQRRFDQAYQYLMSWTPGPAPSTVIQIAQATQEVSDENSCLCPSLHPTSDTNANH